MFIDDEDYGFLTGGLGDLDGDGKVDFVEYLIEEDHYQRIMGNNDIDDFSVLDDDEDIEMLTQAEELGIDPNVREIKVTDSKDIIKPVKKRRIPKPIPRDQYPAPQKADGIYFKDFVAFDVETTGTDVVRDSIIELSAVKVKDGKIVDTFSEFVRPIDKKVPAKANEVNGITNEDVAEAREIWEVFPDFAEFIEDNVLIGYNSLAFDSHVLVRAGRYSHIVLKNKHFDVMHFSRGYLKKQDINNAVSLIELGKMLDIENPQAHRALADAETTAKIYLKLLEIEKSG